MRRAIVAAAIVVPVLLVLAVVLPRPPAARAPSASTEPAAPSAAPALQQPAAPAKSGWQERIVKAPALGRVPVYVPNGPSDLVFLVIGGGPDWDAPSVDLARHLATRGVVIGFSYAALRRAQGHPSCWQPAGVIEDIAKSVESELALPAYRSPLLVGDGIGGSAVYVSLAQAPAGTFTGGLSLAFTPELPTARPLCAIRGWKPVFDEPAASARLPKIAGLNFEWYVLSDRGDAARTASIASFTDGIAHAHATPVDGARGATLSGAWIGAIDEALSQMSPDTGLAAAHAAPPAAVAEVARRLDALKLDLDYSWATAPKAAMIFISGDGGWRDIDRSLAAYVAPRGVSVIGLSSLSYFWRGKSPEQSSQDLKRIADAAADLRLPLFIGGYSFGADVVPFMLDGWPAADRAAVAGQILIAPSQSATFTIDPLAMDWVPFHRTNETAYRVADAAKRIGRPTFCLTGLRVAPADTPCTDLASVATVVKLPGDHHFNGNYAAVGQAVMGFIEQHLR